MSKQIISTTRVTKTYKTSSTSNQYNENQKKYENKNQGSYTSSQISKEVKNQDTKPSAIGFSRVQHSDLSNKNGYLKGPQDQRDSYQNYKVNTYDSNLGSFNQRKLANQGKYVSNQFNTNSLSSYNKATIETNLSSNEGCTCEDFREKSAGYNNKTYKGQSRAINSKNILIQEGSSSEYCNYTSKGGKNIYNNYTLDYDERNSNQIYDKVKSVNQITDIEIIKKQMIEKIKSEEAKNGGAISWDGKNTFIQVIERMQFLAAQPPKLCIQFLNDMMIRGTVDNEPIQVLIPIQDNYIQKQGALEVLSLLKGSREETNLDLIPENVDVLNISHAYSIPIPTFENLDIAKEEIQIKGTETMEEESPVEENNYNIENRTLEIAAGERIWAYAVKPMKDKKINIEACKTDWNSEVKEEPVSKLEIEGVKDEIEEEEEEEEKKVPELETMRFDLNYEENKKRFKTIEIGDRSIVLLRKRRKGSQVQKKLWEPSVSETKSMTIINRRKREPLDDVQTDVINIPAKMARAISKERKLIEEKVKSLTVIGQKSTKKDWGENMKKQKGVKLQIPLRKRIAFEICKEINIYYEQESDEIIFNDDYNCIQGVDMRPITATIIKIKEEEDTSSVSSYDIFQNIIVREQKVIHEINEKNSRIKIEGRSDLFKKKGDSDLVLENGGIFMMENRKSKGNRKIEQLRADDIFENTSKSKGSNFFNDGINVIRNSFENISKKFTWDKNKFTSFNFLNCWESNDGKDSTIKLKPSDEIMEKQQYDVPAN